MHFNDEEVKLIQSARSNLKKANMIRIFAVICMFVLLGLYSLSQLPQTSLFAGLAVVTVIALLAPNLGFGPKYDELVMLLQRKLDETR
jgi:hypothetical protein